MAYSSRESRMANDRLYYQNNKVKRIQSAKDYRLANPVKFAAYQRRSVLKSKYGMSEQEYLLRLESQAGACAICRKPDRLGKSLAVDHDHQTMKNRDLLCSDCNLGLGNFGDDPTLLRAAADYAERHVNG